MAGWILEWVANTVIIWMDNGWVDSWLAIWVGDG